VLRISGSRHRMIAPQPPPQKVFIAVQAMPGRDVPSQRLPPVAAIETSHMVPVGLGPVCIAPTPGPNTSTSTSSGSPPDGRDIGCAPLAVTNPVECNLKMRSAARRAQFV
jgi:hypothetical protein